MQKIAIGDSDDADDKQDSEHELNAEEEYAVDWASLGATNGIGDTGIACSSGYGNADDVSRCGES